MPEKIMQTFNPDNGARRRSRWLRLLAQCCVTMTAVVLAGVAYAQTPTISPAAQQAHATITAYNGPATCVACHQQAAQEMFGSVHYQEMGPTPQVPNLSGPAGKGNNGGRVMNSYCGTPSTSSRATCATCHAGNGRRPSTELTTDQLNNIDCLMCHQDAYKRVPSGPFQTITMPGTNGTTHTIQAVVEDATGFQYVPDQAKMTISVLQAAQTVHKPTRASCLRCHAGAGGSDGGKRGDISTVTVNPPTTSDIHMSPQAGNLSCAACHSAGGHRVRGRGVDLRPSDSTQPLECAGCHTAQPHADYSPQVGTSRDVHAGRVACQTCHIPTFAKDKSTEMERDWLTSEFSMAACRGQGGWLPSEVRASNVVPTYRWFDGTSLANVLDQVPIQDAAGEYVLALPNGSVQSANAKLFPMKVHRSTAAQDDPTGLLVPHSTFGYFTSGDFATAVAEGLTQSGLQGPVNIVNVKEYQTINHGVETSLNALQCGACHSAYTTGGPVRMNLKADLGYALKAPTAQLCSSCHGAKTASFVLVHDKHVRGKGYDCSNCHTFSRPERGLVSFASYRPSAPTGPAVAVTSDSQLKVVWGDNSSSEQGFRVQRSTDGVNFAQVASVGANVTSFIDSGVAGGQAAYYRVVAYNAAGVSDYSQVGRGSTAAVAPPPPAPPATPAGLTATSLSQTQIRLNWVDVADETGYEIQGSADNVTFTVVSTVGAGVTTFTSSGLAAGSTYYYRVRAFNNAGFSSPSSPASATTMVAPPAAPTGLAASAGDARVTLSWNAVSAATSYQVKRSTTSGGPYTTVASGVTATGYTDTTVANGTTYYYVVAAVNVGGTSANSSQVSATPQAPLPSIPAVPTGLAASAGDARVTLSWNAASGATSYQVKRSTTSGGPYTTVASGVTATGYTDTTVANSTTYYYVVSAVNAGGTSANSGQVSATPQAPTATVLPPTEVQARPGSYKKIVLEWRQSASPNITGYRVYRSTSATGEYSRIASVSSRQTYTDSRATPGATYYYVVTAVDASGRESAFSNQASATATPRR